MFSGETDRQLHAINKNTFKSKTDHPLTGTLAILIRIDLHFEMKLTLMTISTPEMGHKPLASNRQNSSFYQSDIAVESMILALTLKLAECLSIYTSYVSFWVGIPAYSKECGIDFKVTRHRTPPKILSIK